MLNIKLSVNTFPSSPTPIPSPPHKAHTSFVVDWKLRKESEGVRVNSPPWALRGQIPYTVLIGIRTSWRKWGQNALLPHHFLDSYEETHLMMFLVSCFSKKVRYHDVHDSRERRMGERFRRWKLWGVLLTEQFREPQWLRQCRLCFLKMGLLLQFSSVQWLSHIRLWDPMDRSTPGLPGHHQLPEFTQTHCFFIPHLNSHSSNSSSSTVTS